MAIADGDIPPAPTRPTWLGARRAAGRRHRHVPQDGARARLPLDHARRAGRLLRRRDRDDGRGRPRQPPPDAVAGPGRRPLGRSDALRDGHGAPRATCARACPRFATAPSRRSRRPRRSGSPPDSPSSDVVVALNTARRPRRRTPAGPRRRGCDRRARRLGPGRRPGRSRLHGPRRRLPRRHRSDDRRRPDHLLRQTYMLTDPTGSGEPFGEIALRLFRGGRLTVGGVDYDLEPLGLVPAGPRLASGGRRRARDATELFRRAHERHRRRRGGRDRRRPAPRPRARSRFGRRWTVSADGARGGGATGTGHSAPGSRSTSPTRSRSSPARSSRPCSPSSAATSATTADGLRRSSRDSSDASLVVLPLPDAPLSLVRLLRPRPRLRRDGPAPGRAAAGPVPRRATSRSRSSSSTTSTRSRPSRAGARAGWRASPALRQRLLAADPHTRHAHRRRLLQPVGPRHGARRRRAPRRAADGGRPQRCSAWTWPRWATTSSTSPRRTSGRA